MTAPAPSLLSGTLLPVAATLSNDRDDWERRKTTQCQWYSALSHNYFAPAAARVSERRNVSCFDKDEKIEPCITSADVGLAQGDALRKRPNSRKHGLSSQRFLIIRSRTSCSPLSVAHLSSPSREDLRTCAMLALILCFPTDASTRSQPHHLEHGSKQERTQCASACDDANERIYTSFAALARASRTYCALCITLPAARDGQRKTGSRSRPSSLRDRNRCSTIDAYGWRL